MSTDALQSDRSHLLHKKELTVAVESLSDLKMATFA
jgi:hypothetical protein